MIDSCTDIYNGKIIYNEIPSESNIGYCENFSKGNDIEQLTKTLFRLKKDEVYQISYNINTLGLKNGFIEINTRLDGVNKEEVSYFEEIDKIYDKLSINNTFCIKLDCTDRYLDFTISAFKKFIVLDGEISIIKL